MAAFAVFLFCHLYFSTVWSEEWFSNAPSHSRTPYEVIKHHLKTLDTKGIDSGSYSLLSVDEKHNHLLVGARNHALLVDLDNIDSYVLWNVTKPSSSITCDKNKDVLCNNFIKVMLPFEERIFLCWMGPTAACSWRNRTDLSNAPGKDNLGNVFKTEEKYSVPSLSLDQNDTTVITENGTLFTGTMNPISIAKSMIYSMSFKEPILQLTYSSLMDQSWFFTDVQFVKSFDIGHYVYFFFRERTLECSSCGKSKISRVARICKGDYGGRYSLKNVFVTFQKAKLSCSDGKDYPVNFNEIQDVWWDKHTKLFHAIFTSHPNGPPSSAICIYSLSAINQVFDDSSFKSFESNDKHWSLVDNKHKEFFPDCKVNAKYIDSSNHETVPSGMMATRKMTYAAYRQLMHDPLMADSVEPTNSQAWFIKDGIRMTAITLEKVASNTVVYASTDRGSVLKLSQPVGVNQPCLLAEMNIFPVEKKEIIKSMALDTKRHFLYLGSSTTLAQLSLEQCSNLLNQSSCISAADPYCGWDINTTSCVPALSHGELKQDLSTCPKVKDVGWSPWKNCIQNDGNLCRCKVRPCQDKQNSSCGGGLEYRLENCTVDISVGWEGTESWEKLGVQHGNWSVWGNWGECSAKAWAGVKNRSRTCTNPVPRRGGRPCVGEAVQYKPCSLGIEGKEKSVRTETTRVLNRTVNMTVQFKVNCRAKGYKITDISIELDKESINCTKEQKLCGEGEWNDWSEWSQCSVEGFQIRRRNYTQQQTCVGERLQDRNCKTPSKKCNDRSWDEWSDCVCNHNLEVKTGLKYRVPICRRECPNEPSCPRIVEFENCSCNTPSVVGAQVGSNSPHNSNFGIGHVIGAAIIGCVFTITLCIAAICYVNRRKKHFNVSKAEENSLQDASNESKFSTIPRAENVQLLKDPSTPGNKDKNRNSRIKTPSPLKILFTKRKQHYPVDAV